MHILNNIGIALMIIAALSLLALAIEAAYRHGGEGMLMALGLAAAAIIPAWTAMNMGDVKTDLVAIVISAWMSIILIILGVIGLVLMWQRQKEGMICLGLSLVLGAAVYAIAPGYITSAQQQEATQSAT